ncbi:hypothetical protein Ga0074115_13510 [endosymbiont of Ridgeia piscesae]|jgi:hypothetical protein|uniref:DUF5619 domain-containing protein n=1 Tax=endosymbiont of Ridgeia piscesae TaxID=54398 RepID=A0A0T5Z063_9GAMM|nr:AF1514 family protein [endosymbiont of Ridgeia piscesae]KRT56220.1 hypothetical protein Ga0074115_13510 [endosymbiont of Ridgeia piscesae]
MSDRESEEAAVCMVRREPEMHGIEVVELNPDPALPDYLEGMKLADAQAQSRLGEFMLLSWYDRDRNFESPQHSSECHQDAAVPGYVDYGIHHGAKLKIDIEQGRFVFFYMPQDF